MKYRKVSVYIWNDSKFSTLSDDGKLLFLFILTHPHMTSVGSMRTSIDGLSAELCWTLNKTQKGFRELFQKGLVKHNKRACCVVLPNFLKHNPPENPNVVKSWSRALELIPECDLKIELINLLKSHVSELSTPYKEAFKSVSKGFAIPFQKGLPKQEQEQEQIIPPISPTGLNGKSKRKPAEPPTETQVVEYFVENGYLESAAKKAHAYYEAGDWKDSQGKPVKSWKQKMRGVWFKDENLDPNKKQPLSKAEMEKKWGVTLP